MEERRTREESLRVSAEGRKRLFAKNGNARFVCRLFENACQLEYHKV